MKDFKVYSVRMFCFGIISWSVSNLQIIQEIITVLPHKVNTCLNYLRNEIIPYNWINHERTSIPILKKETKHRQIKIIIGHVSVWECQQGFFPSSASTSLMQLWLPLAELSVQRERNWMGWKHEPFPWGWIPGDLKQRKSLGGLLQVVWRQRLLGFPWSIVCTSLLEIKS